MLSPQRGRWWFAGREPAWFYTSCLAPSGLGARDGWQTQAAGLGWLATGPLARRTEPAQSWPLARRTEPAQSWPLARWTEAAWQAFSFPQGQGPGASQPRAERAERAQPWVSGEARIRSPEGAQ